MRDFMFSMKSHSVMDLQAIFKTFLKPCVISSDVKFELSLDLDYPAA